MNKHTHPLARGVSYLLIVLTALQPALAGGITASQAATQVQQGTVPVVTIAPPNAAGISHNRYADFNIAQPGAVLNNSTVAGQSALAGALDANASLQGKAAQLIINEVTGSSRSELQGQLEVFGQRADVMIANPNGINCDGCGAINSAGLTLTTGKPQLDAQGMLHALEVTQGTVSIGPGGLNGSGQDYVEILSRACELNGRITARSLALTQGANRIDYHQGRVEPIAGVGAAPQLAVDTKALGGMYASKIRLLGTEQGVGVNLSHITSDQQSIVLSANGKLQLADINAKTDLNASGREISVAAGNRLNAGNDMTLSADALTNQGSVVAAKDMRIFSERISNTGSRARLEAGNNLWLQKDAQGAKALLVENRSGTITTGSGDMVIRTEKLNNLRDRLVLGTRQGEHDETGTFLYDDAFNAAKYPDVSKRPKSNAVRERFLRWWGPGTLFERAIIRYFADVWVNNESTEYFSLTSEQPGVIASGHHLYASAGELTNAASSISSGGKMVLTGNHLEVLSYDGGIKKDFSIYRRDVAADGEYERRNLRGYNNFFKTATQGVALETGETLNSRLSAEGDLVADFSDSISASLPLPFAPTEKTELTSALRPDTFSARNILLHAGRITSNDGMTASGNMTLIADDAILNQRGSLTAGGNLSLTAINDIENIQGNLWGESVELLSRQGSILSSTPDQPRAFSADRMQLFSTINAGALAISAGKHIALNDTELQVQHSISANSGGDLTIAASDRLLTPPDFLKAGSTLTAFEHYNRALLIPGRAAVDGEISLTAGGEMALNGVGLRAGKGILLSAGQSISLSPRTISQQNRLLDKWLTVESHAKYFPSWRAPELRASLNSGADLQIHAAADITAQGAQLTSVGTTTLYAGRDLLLGAQAYSFIDASNDNNKDERQLVADIQAGKNLTLAANGSLITQGSSVSAGGDLTATAGGNMRFESVANRIYRELSNGYSETLSQQGTALTSGGVLTLIGSGSILFQATRLLAQRSLDVAAQGGYLYAQAMEESSSYEKKTTKRKWWGKKTTIRQTGRTVTNKVTAFTAGEDISLLSGEDSTFEASKINAGRNASLISQRGQVNFRAVNNSAFEQTVTTSKGFFIRQANRGYKASSWVLPTVHFGGALTIEAAEGISADVKAQNRQQLQATLAVLGNAPGNEWLNALNTRTDVQWKPVQDAYENWDYHHQSLNPAVAAVIAIAAAAVTAGSGLAATAGSAAAGSTGGMTGTAAFGGGYSGMMALTSQAAVALVENQGDLSKTLKALGSRESVKSLATSMAVGGALAGFDRVLDIQAVNPGNARLPVLANDNWLKVAQRVAGQSVISSGLTTVINGGSFQDNFSKALLASLGEQLNAEGAGLIGDNGAVLGEPGRVLSHAVVSGISAEIAGGSAKGAAVGALAAEVAGIVMQSTLFEPQYLNENERQLDRLQEALNGSEAKAQTARFVGALAGAISTHTPEGAYSAAKSGELVYRYNMTEHMLEQFALEQQLDTLAADKGDSDAAIRVAGRRDAMAAVVIVGSGGLAAMVGGTVIAAAAPEMILAARLALAGCKSNPVLCLNQAGIYAADIAAPEAAVGTGSLLAGSTILVGKSQEEAVQFGRQVVAASGNLLKDGKANQGKLGEFIAGKVTSGAENAATYPKLKDDLIQQNLSNIAKQDPRLEIAIKGDGSGGKDFAMGQGSRLEADRLGKIWLGDGAKQTSGGGWISADGTRGYRSPSTKNSPFAVTGTQANFDSYIIDPAGKPVKVGNGHLNILD